MYLSECQAFEVGEQGKERAEAGFFSDEKLPVFKVIFPTPWSKCAKYAAKYTKISYTR
jgi:hypothetical protein